jgi:hypothetical protein
MMRKINATARNVLNRIINKMNNKEKISDDIKCKKITAKFYVVGSYVEIEGELMSIPEIVFYYDDNEFYPVSYRNDCISGNTRESVQFLNNGSYNVKQQLQKQQVNFANQWLIGIEKLIS